MRTTLDHFIRLYMVYIFVLIISQGCRSLLIIGWKKLQILRHLF
jgi:hypothetical protein